MNPFAGPDGASANIELHTWDPLEEAYVRREGVGVITAIVSVDVCASNATPPTQRMLHTPGTQLDGAARQELLALEVLRGVEGSTMEGATAVAALHNTVTAMRSQVIAVSGALEGAHELGSSHKALKAAHADLVKSHEALKATHATTVADLKALKTAQAELRSEVTAALTREMAPLRGWFDVFGAEAMGQITRLRPLDNQAVEAARLVDVGLANAGTVPDIAFTAYGNLNTSYLPHQGRLNHGSHGCLLSSARAGVDWIQVTLPAYMVIGAVSWQGYNHGSAVSHCWRTLSLRVSMDGIVWRDADGGAQFTRPGGTPDSTVYTANLRVGHLCRFVRLVYHAVGSAGGGSEYVRWELKHLPAP
jgi:hypothetical protein